MAVVSQSVQIVDAQGRLTPAGYALLSDLLRQIAEAQAQIAAIEARLLAAGIP